MPNQTFKPWDSPQIEASNVACKAELDYILALWIINKVV